MNEFQERLLFLERSILQDFFDEILHVRFPVALGHGEANSFAGLESAAGNDGLVGHVGNGVFAAELQVGPGFCAGGASHLGFIDAGDFDVAHSDDNTVNFTDFIELRRGNQEFLLAELGVGHGEIADFLAGEGRRDACLACEFAAHLLCEPSGEVVCIVRKVVGNVIGVLDERLSVKNGDCVCRFSPARVNVLQAGLGAAKKRKRSKAKSQREYFFSCCPPMREEVKFVVGTIIIKHRFKK